jgi:hypothetical protein
MNPNGLVRTVSLLIAIPVVLAAQPPRFHDPAMLKSWEAPLYWQPTQAREERSNAPQATAANMPLGYNAMVFVAMTPCRIADTRASQGFTGAFGAPSLVGGATGRTFPILSNTTCPVPSVAQAYSFNLTIVAPAPYGFITAYPTPGPMPLAATLNWATPLIVGNAAIVPVGTNGSVDIFASANTDLVIDINGYYAAPSDLNGNTALGVGTLANNSAGSQNTASGSYALAGNTRGSFNTASGAQALQWNSIGGDNTASGYQALQWNGTGGDNTASGYQALQSNTTGSWNTASGSRALQSNTTGSWNTASGYQALQNSTIAGGNTANGYQALQADTTGTFNPGSGYQALQWNTTGLQNTASGASALRSNTTGLYNSATGSSALGNNTTGTGNTATGASALSENTTGGDNTATGTSALSENTTGSDNTASGASALAGNTTGRSNTAIGYWALGANTTGSYNIAIGDGAAMNVSAGNGNNIHIGHSGSSADNGAIRIGTAGAQTSFFVAGVRGVKTGNNDAIPVMVDSSGQLGTVNSSRRFKEDIRDMGEASGGLLRLRPVTFRYRQPFADGSKPIEYGLIAEEVAEVYPDLVAHSADGQIETVKYQVLDSMLLNELQKEHEEVRQLKARLAALEQLLSGKAAPAVSAGQ